MAVEAVALPGDVDEVRVRPGRLRLVLSRAASAARLRGLVGFGGLVVVGRRPVANVAGRAVATGEQRDERCGEGEGREVRAGAEGSRCQYAMGGLGREPGL